MNSRQIQFFFPLLLALAFLFLYFSFISHFAVDMPNSDDFDMYLVFLQHYLESGSSTQKLALLFQPHGEHLIFTTRLTGVLLYKLMGVVNFRTVIILGNLAIPLCIILIYCLRSSLTSARILALATIAIALLQPQYIQAALWAAAAIEHLWVMVFVLAVFVLAERFEGTSPVQYFFLMIFLAAAAFTQGNGIFAVGLVTLLLLYKRLWWWAIPPGLFSLALLLHYLKHLPLGNSNHHLSFFDLVLYVCGFLGAPLGASFAHAAIWGALLLCLFLFLAPSSLSKHQGLVSLGIFVVLTAVANALARGQFGVEYAYTQSRYVYPALFFISATYLLLLQKIPARNTSRNTITVTLLVAIAAGWNYSRYWTQAELRRNVLLESAARWQIARTGVEYPDQVRGDELYSSALSQGLVNSTPQAFPVELSIPLQSELPKSPLQELRGSLEWTVVGNRYVLISGYVLSPTTASAPTLEVALRSSTKFFKMPAHLRPRPDADENHRLSGKKALGFLIISEKNLLPPGDYAISVIVSEKQIFRSSKRIIASVINP
jgi:hypothetical protein